MFKHSSKLIHRCKVSLLTDSRESQDESILARPTDDLAQAYENFLKRLPKYHQARIEDGPPSLNVVIDALTVAEDTWKNNREKTKAGRMKVLFGKVAQNLNGYTELFAIIPRSGR